MEFRAVLLEFESKTIFDKIFHHRRVLQKILHGEGGGGSGGGGGGGGSGGGGAYIPEQIIDVTVLGSGVGVTLNSSATTTMKLFKEYSDNTIDITIDTKSNRDMTLDDNKSNVTMKLIPLDIGDIDITIMPRNREAIFIDRHIQDCDDVSLYSFTFNEGNETGTGYFSEDAYNALVKVNVPTLINTTPTLLIYDKNGRVELGAVTVYYSEEIDNSILLVFDCTEILKRLFIHTYELTDTEMASVVMEHFRFMYTDGSDVVCRVSREDLQVQNTVVNSNPTCSMVSSLRVANGSFDDNLIQNSVIHISRYGNQRVRMELEDNSDSTTVLSYLTRFGYTLQYKIVNSDNQEPVYRNVSFGGFNIDLSNTTLQHITRNQYTDNPPTTLVIQAVHSDGETICKELRYILRIQECNGRNITTLEYTADPRIIMDDCNTVNMKLTSQAMEQANVESNTKISTGVLCSYDDKVCTHEVSVTFNKAMEDIVATLSITEDTVYEFVEPFSLNAHATVTKTSIGIPTYTKPLEPVYNYIWYPRILAEPNTRHIGTYNTHYTSNVYTYTIDYAIASLGTLGFMENVYSGGFAELLATTNTVSLNVLPYKPVMALSTYGDELLINNSSDASTIRTNDIYTDDSGGRLGIANRLQIKDVIISPILYTSLEDRAVGHTIHTGELFNGGQLPQDMWIDYHTDYTPIIYTGEGHVLTDRYARELTITYEDTHAVTKPLKWNELLVSRSKDDAGHYDIVLEFKEEAE